MSEELRVIELKAESFMGIKLAELKLDANGDLIVVGGRNGQGKTSLLNAIECAIRGKTHHPGMPVQRGKEKAEINLDLGAYKIRRRFKNDGSSTIRVSNAEGFESTRPQELMDGLAKAITFDPLEFKTLGKKKQLEVVRDLAGVDTTKIEEQYAAVFKDRAEVNAVVKNITGEISAMPRHPDVGFELLSPGGMVDELKAISTYNAGTTRLRKELLLVEAKVESTSEELEEAHLALQRLKDKLEGVRVEREEANRDWEAREGRDPEPLEKRLHDMDETNRKIQDNINAKARTDARSAKQKVARALGDELVALAEKKQKLIAGASLPLPGLSFDGGGVTLNGIPFEQVSESESLQASVAIGVVLNPDLKVMLIRNGSLLDDESMSLLAEVAKENSYQIWIERVGTNDEGAIVIEAGEVVGAEPVEEPEVEATAGADPA